MRALSGRHLQPVGFWCIQVLAPSATSWAGLDGSWFYPAAVSGTRCQHACTARNPLQGAASPVTRIACAKNPDIAVQASKNQPGERRMIQGSDVRSHMEHLAHPVTPLLNSLVEDSFLATNQTKVPSFHARACEALATTVMPQHGADRPAVGPARARLSRPCQTYLHTNTGPSAARLSREGRGQQKSKLSSIWGPKQSAMERGRALMAFRENSNAWSASSATPSPAGSSC